MPEQKRECCDTEVNQYHLEDCPTHKLHQEEAQEFTGKISRLSDAFDALCQDRHLAGQEEYGKLTFLGNDVTRMMIEELADTANYCRYQAVKLMLLQDALEEQLSDELLEPGQDEITIGVKAFKGVGEVGWGKR